MNEPYYIYVNGFWGGFVDKTDANHIDFFENLFKKTKLANYEITNHLNKANVLFESLFSHSMTNVKKWKYKIHYSGEPRRLDSSNYDIVLYSEIAEGSNIVDVPLFAYYIHGNHFLDKLIHRPIVKSVPPNFCCFIVSNSGCWVRNQMFYRLNQYKKVDSYGGFENNMGGSRLKFDYWTEEFRQFLSTYKFIICFENTKIGTYSTEKIVNPYLSGTIPIYWSSHHIKNIFNSDSMLFLEDESDASYQILINKIKELDNDDEKYLELINRPVFTDMNLQYWNENYTVEKMAEKIDMLL